MYTYSCWEWLAFFYLYCFFGWIFESVYVSVKTRHPVNRGFLRLPLLPLYGTGAVMMLWVSLPIQGSLLLVFLAGVAAATALEYMTGAVMEKLFRVRYWDYTGQRFNRNGYICLKSSLAWGVLTLFLTEVIHRPVEQLISAIPQVILIPLAGLVSACFTVDVIQSVRAALDLGKVLEAMTQARRELEELQVQLALLKREIHDAIDLNGDDRLELSELKAAAAQLAADKAEEVQEKISRLMERARSLPENLKVTRIRLLLRNPSASSARFKDALKELQRLPGRRNKRR